MPARHVALAVAVAVVWGINFVVIDVGLDAFPPLLFVALRFTLTAFPAVLFVARVPAVPLRFVAGVGLLIGAGQFGLLFVGMHEGMPAGLASLVLQLQAPFTIGLAVGLLGERLNRGQVLGGLVALAGIGVIAGGRAEGVPLGAFALCVGAAFSWACGNIATRRAQSPSAAGLLVWSSVFAVPPLVVLSLALEGPADIGDALAGLDGSGVLALLYVVVLATGFRIRLVDLAHAPPPRLPRRAVHAAGASGGHRQHAWVFLAERPNGAENAGGAIVLFGLWLTTRALEVRRRDPVVDELDADGQDDQAEGADQRVEPAVA